MGITMPHTRCTGNDAVKLNHFWVIWCAFKLVIMISGIPAIRRNDRISTVSSTWKGLFLIRTIVLASATRIARERERKHALHYRFTGVGHTSISQHDRPRDRESAHEGPQRRF